MFTFYSIIVKSFDAATLKGTFNNIIVIAQVRHYIIMIKIVKW